MENNRSSNAYSKDKASNANQTLFYSLITDLGGLFYAHSTNIAY